MNSTAKAKIMVVDDQEIMRTFLKLLLEMSGYEVNAVGNGKAGLELLKSWKPDVTLLDRMMPGMTGDEFLEKVRKDTETQDAQVIFVTAKASDTDKTEGLAFQPNAYISKPFQNQELLLAIKRCLASTRE